MIILESHSAEEDVDVRLISLLEEEKGMNITTVEAELKGKMKFKLIMLCDN